MYSQGQSPITILVYNNMESDLPKIEIKPSLLISHKSINPICPLSWLVSSELNSGLYGA